MCVAECGDCLGGGSHGLPLFRSFLSLLPAGMMSNLKSLDLSHNRVGDKGACALAAMLISEGLSSSVPLQCLELEGNQVGGG